MLITRPLPTAPGGCPLPHILEVVEILDDGRERAPVLGFLSGLTVREQQAIYSRFEHLERSGYLEQPSWRSMGNWFKRLQNIGDAWELGDDNRVRFYGFRGPGGLLLTNASKKRGSKTPMADLKRCVQLRERFLEEHRNG